MDLPRSAAFSDAEIVPGSVKTREGTDFADQVRYKLVEAMSYPRGSSARIDALKDLDILLEPYRDSDYWAATKALKAELLPDGREEADRGAFADGVARILNRVMWKAGFHGKPDLYDEEPDD